MATKPKSGSKNAGVAAGLLGDMAALIPTNAKPKAGKATKWEMVLTPEARIDADRWINGKTVLEPVEKRVENAKSDFMEYALDIMIDKIFANKSKASNPLVILYKPDGKTVDHQFQVTMVDKFKFRFPDVPEGTSPRDHFIEVFKNLGLHPDSAEKLVDEELDFNPIIGFKNLKAVLEGTYIAGREWVDSSDDEKAAGNKFLALFMWNGDGDAPEALTVEEKGLLIERSNGMQVKSGFYDRVATYCQTKEQLRGIFSIIQPIIYPSSPKFGVNDSETEKTSRKIEAAADILGTGVSVE
jgi:hypothetical protein